MDCCAHIPQSPVLLNVIGSYIFPELNGTYELVLESSKEGQPYWRHKAASELYCYLLDGFWRIGRIQKFTFGQNAPSLRSGDKHCGRLPHEMSNWKRYASYKQRQVNGVKVQAVLSKMLLTLHDSGDPSDGEISFFSLGGNSVASFRMGPGAWKGEELKAVAADQIQHPAWAIELLSPQGDILKDDSYYTI